MRYILIIVLFLTCSLAYADDIADLKTERENLQSTLAQYQQAIQNVQVRIIEINGILGYLTEKEKEKEKEE